MNIYSKKRYKKLLIVPVILLIGSLFFTTQLTYGMEFRGGSRISAPLKESVDTAQLERDLNDKFKVIDLEVKQTLGGRKLLLIEYTGNSHIVKAENAMETGDYLSTIQNAKQITGELNLDIEDQKEKARAYISEAEEQFQNQITAYLSERTGVESNKLSFNTIGASLGQRFLEQAKNAVFAALLLIAILVFYFFRKIVVSLAVFQAAVYDLIFGIGAAGLFGIPITLGTIAALLMLIGYSIDSDIMLVDRIMKRKKGKKEERAHEAMKTGLTMTLTTLGALSGLFIVSYLTHIQILTSISIILIIGLIGDLIATWLTNTPLVLWYMDKEGME